VELAAARKTRYRSEHLCHYCSLTHCQRRANLKGTASRRDYLVSEVLEEMAVTKKKFGIDRPASLGPSLWSARQARQRKRRQRLKMLGLPIGRRLSQPTRTCIRSTGRTLPLTGERMLERQGFGLPFPILAM